MCGNICCGPSVCHLRSDFNKCWAFHPGFHHLSFGQCQMLPVSHHSHRHTHAPRRGGDGKRREKDRKRRDRGGEINVRGTCCLRAHVAVQSSIHPALYSTGKPKHASTMPSSDCLRGSIGFLITKSQTFLHQVKDKPTNNSKCAITGKMC